MFDDEGTGRGIFETPLICENGHTVTSALEEYPEKNSKFCPDCGSSTTSQCTKCSEKIRGHHKFPGFTADDDSYIPPSFCPNCGTPYTWTEKRIESARELADMLDDLSSSDKEQLKSDISKLARDSPESKVAAVRFNKIIAKIAPQAGAVIKDILVDVVSESVKKIIWS
jgi:hypothetical protein